MMFRLAPCLILGNVLALQLETRESLPSELEVPDKYTLNYPGADRCCPPIRSTFVQADRSFSVVRGRRFRHKPNGGYGLPIVDKVNGKNLLHVGADLGWHQVGEPVFAIANGIVRISTGPDLKSGRKRETRSRSTMAWGNLIALEHRFGDTYVTTVYGHLGTDRLVKAGDIVSVGQQIGTIGRRHSRVNGGYTPHLHFGVRTGRNAQVGSVLLRLSVHGRAEELKLARVTEESIELGSENSEALPVRLTLNGRRYRLQPRDGRLVAPAAMLWQIQRPDFALVGYALSADGWNDPIRFLRDHAADSMPAPFQPNFRRRRR